MGTKIFEECRDGAVRRYLAGEPLEDIEVDTGAARRTIRQWAKERGHQPRSLNRVSPARRKRVVELYLDGWRVEDICEVLEVSRGFVKTTRRRAGVPARGPGGSP